MEDERRVHLRTPYVCRIKVTHASIGTGVVKTRDVSDGGLFLITDGVEMPPVGTLVQGQVQETLREAPMVKMEVVRIEPAGIGLRFLD